LAAFALVVTMSPSTARASDGATISGLVTAVDKPAGVAGVAVQLWSTAEDAPLKALTKGKASISGSAKVGKKLKVKLSKWKPSGIHYSYQWLRNGVVISGATKSTYKIAKADKKGKISVRLTASKAGYFSILMTSKATSKVK
jgi:hypothetical protein